MRNLRKIDPKRALIVLMALFVIVPFLSFAGNSKKIYVDSKAGDTQDGTSAHPYKTISKALDKADKNTEVHVANGTYKENLTVPRGAEIYGNDRDKTIIEAKNDDKSTIYLNGGAKLTDLTIKKGKTGIKVANEGRVKIIHCNISKNDSDGIFISSESLKDSNQVTISESDISDNGRNGIYSEKRNVIIYKSNMYRNKSDGAYFEAGFKAWIGQSDFKDNSGSGMVAILDGTQIYTKSNTYSSNKHEGIEVSSYGVAGKIDINKSKIRSNGSYGVSRIERKVTNANIWNGLTVQNTSFINTIKGEISGIFRILK